MGRAISGQNLSTGGTLSNSGAISSANDIGVIKIAGSLVGNATNAVEITARGLATVTATTKTDAALGSVTIGGSLTYANIEAGYNVAGVAVDGDASIGAITIAGNVSASNIVAGVAPGTDGVIGTNDDAVVVAGVGTTNVAGLIAKIASIKIGGQILGTPSATNSTDHFAIETQAIGSLMEGGVKISLAPAGSVTLSESTGGDVSAREFPTP